jgi:hypothetical protein
MHLGIFRRLAKDDRGSAIAGVVGLMVVTAVVAVSISAVSLNALATTGSTRAAVQAQAAAESGIAATVATLNTAACQPAYSRTVAPAYAVAISWGASATGSWTTGCPTTASYIRLVSTGTPGTAALGGLGATRYVEAIYRYTPTVAAGITPSGAALYSYSSSGSSISGLTLNAAGTARPSVQVYSGLLNCASSSTINGDFSAGSGDVIMSSGNCTVNGNVSAAGMVYMAGSAVINGNVSASGVSSYNGSGNYSFVSTNGGANVNGNVTAAGPALVQGNITGNLIAGPATGNATRFVTGANVGGSVTVAGALQSSGQGQCASPLNNPDTDSASAQCALQQAPKHVVGAVNYGVTGITAPAAPVVPSWTDYKYKPSDWPGYNIVTLGSGDCSWTWAGSSGIIALQLALASSTPTVLDARACSQIDFYYSLNPALRANLVIVAGSFNMGNATWSSANSTQRNLWLIVSDDTADGSPTCAGRNTSVLSSGFTVSGSVTGMFYSPCSISTSSTTWRGQFYSANTVMNQNQTINYDPLGLPGVNLDAGSGGAAAGGGSNTGLGTLAATATSYRDVSSAG